MPGRLDLDSWLSRTFPERTQHWQKQQVSESSHYLSFESQGFKPSDPLTPPYGTLSHPSWRMGRHSRSQLEGLCGYFVEERWRGSQEMEASLVLPQLTVCVDWRHGTAVKTLAPWPHRFCLTLAFCLTWRDLGPVPHPHWASGPTSENHWVILSTTVLHTRHWDPGLTTASSQETFGKEI